MATSPLDPANPPLRPDRSLGRGHGTSALGPSDSSDSGSDVQGARDADFGDANLDSDTDRYGTGERADVGGTIEPDGVDIAPDRIEKVEGEDEEEE
jgi:hypothetical protein